MSRKCIAPRQGCRRQKGFLIPLALFILVGLLALSMAMSRLTSQSGTSATLEMLSTQAFFAAESGGQYAMHQLFFDAADQATVNNNCDALASPPNFTAPGLQLCSVQVTCSRTTSAGTGFYTITSAANCGTGDLSAQRSIQISAFMHE